MLDLSADNQILYHNHIILVAPMSEIRAGLPLWIECGGSLRGTTIAVVGIAHLEVPAWILLIRVVVAAKLAMDGSVSIW